MSASVGGSMSQRNIATRIVSPGPAASKRVLARPSTVGSAGTVGGEVKQASIPARLAQPDFPRGLRPVVARAGRWSGACAGSGQ